MLRLFVGILWALVMACGSTRPTDRVRVVQLGPTGEAAADDVARGVTLLFDRPVVPPAEVGREIERPPVALSPRVPGRARWIDRQTLVFVPAEPLKSDTRYHVRLDGALRAPSGGAVEWSGGEFVFERLRLVSASFPSPGERFQPARPQVTVAFSLPVVPAVAARACLFDGPDGGVPAHVHGGDTDAPSRSVVLTPARALRAGAEHHLRCGVGLRSAAGDTGLAADFDAPFFTFGPLSVEQVSPTGQDVSADEVFVQVTFANPVPPSEVARLVTLAPAARPGRPVKVAFAGTQRRSYAARLNLEPSTEYLLTVKAGLRDDFGQQLERDRLHRFRVGAAAPRLAMRRGIFAVEAASGRYPIWTRNLADFDLECARVPESRVVALLTGPMNYDSWYDAEEGGDLDYAKHGLKARRQRVRIADAKNRWVDVSVDLAARCGGDPSRPAGLYVLTARGRDVPLERHERPRRALANVTDLGLVAKVGNASSLVWVVRLSTGEPVAGAVVEIRDLKGQLRHSGTTTVQGIATAPGATTLLGLKPRSTSDEDEEDFEGFRGRRVIVSARHGADLAVLDTNWNNGIQVWNFGVPENRGGGTVRVRGLLQSDRGLYRPGDTVHLRGLARIVEAAGAMRVPREKRVHLTIEDPRGTTIVDEDIRLTRFGGFARDLEVAADARLGDYHVTGRLAGQTFRERFAVEEYRPHTFEIRVEPAARHQLAGDRLRFGLAASYLYGAPVSTGRVAWSLRRRPFVASFPALPQFGFGDHAALWDESNPWQFGEARSLTDPVADGERGLDSAGRVTVSARDDAKRTKGPFDYLLEATVTDASGQAVTVHAVTTAHRAGLYLGLHPAERVQAVNMPFAVQAVAVAPDGSRRDAAAELTLARRRYDCGEGQVPWGRCPRREDAPAVRRTVSIPATGVAVERVTLKEPGEYLVRLTADDGRGGQALTSDLLYVIGEGEAFWSGDESDRMGLVASKPSYRPGETARVVPQTRMGGALALVTLERDGVMRSFTIRLGQTGQGIEVPIDDSLAPNAFLSVTLVRGRTAEPGPKGRPLFKMGLVNLTVDAGGKRLAVHLETERPSYRPGETVRAALKVTTQGGAPVRAEVAVAAADEGVLQIVGYQTPDPMKVFYAPWGLGVESATNWNRIARGRDPADPDNEEGGDGGGEDAGRIRSRFMATAFWAPALVTDADGTARVSFTAPDNLTAFRLMAVAADAGDRFGSGEVRFTVQKPLLVMPALPRFISAGDQVKAAVIVHNRTGAAGRATVTLEVTGARLRSPTRQEVDLAAGATRPVVFLVGADRPPTARFRFAATLGGAEDIVEVTVPVTKPLVRETITLGEASTAAQAELPLAVPTGIVAGEGGLEVTLDTTGLGRLDESVRYLVGYPYGCLEQTTSRVVPMVALRELVRSLDLGVSRSQLDGFVETGIAKILRHQHQDGAFGLWPGASPEPHLTAYALFGLGLARQAGYRVDQKAVTAGVASLRKAVTRSEPRVDSAAALGSLGAQAFALHVLATLGQPEPGAAARLYEQRAAVPVYGQAFLARALKRGGMEAEARALVAEIAATAPAGTGPVLLRERDQERLWYYMSSAPRTTAVVLSALLDVAPTHPLIPRLQDGLLGAREQGRWSNTQENLYALVALADLAHARRQGGPATVTVSLAGRKLATARLARTEVKRLSVPVGKLTSGTLVIAAAGREVFYAARLRVARPVSDEAEARGLVVERAYLDPRTGEPVRGLKVGQAVRVRVTVRATGPQAHVAVVDHLPAALEPVLDRGPRAEEESRRPWWLRDRITVWQHREARDDRVEFFTDLLASGTSTAEYLARATSAGIFMAPPATAEAMYRPALWGRSGGEKVAVTR